MDHPDEFRISPFNQFKHAVNVQSSSLTNLMSIGSSFYDHWLPRCLAKRQESAFHFTTEITDKTFYRDERKWENEKGRGQIYLRQNFTIKVCVMLFIQALSLILFHSIFNN
uniref:Uncharacterized protein n=1 Tax=Rhizophagus irregularis (strain DAOM 181602 / DAOM 197198 / MUCL 43194) TaxID=747089 RepID=U9SL33_RHIID